MKYANAQQSSISTGFGIGNARRGSRIQGSIFKSSTKGIGWSIKREPLLSGLPVKKERFARPPLGGNAKVLPQGGYPIPPAELVVGPFGGELLIDEIKRRNIEGNVAELGVYKGEFAKILRFYFPQKELYLYDTFEGFDDRDKINEKFTDEWMQIFKNTSLEKVQALVGKNNITHYRKGWFPESILDEEKEKKFCFVSLDADMYAPTFEGLKFFYPRLVEG